jgi:hypothetical protein
MRVEYTKWMELPNHDLTPTGQMWRASISQVKNSSEFAKQTFVKSVKKCDILTEDALLFEESESSDNNNSNDECDSSDEDFRGSCGQ